MTLRCWIHSEVADRFADRTDGGVQFRGGGNGGNNGRMRRSSDLNATVEGVSDSLPYHHSTDSSQALGVTACLHASLPKLSLDHHLRLIYTTSTDIAPYCHLGTFKQLLLAGRSRPAHHLIASDFVPMAPHLPRWTGAWWVWLACLPAFFLMFSVEALLGVRRNLRVIASNGKSTASCY